jgi:hypothetical protein
MKEASAFPIFDLGAVAERDEAYQGNINLKSEVAK